MSLRQNLVEIIKLMDDYPQIKTDKMSGPATTALKKFREKFDQAIAQIEEEKPWEDLKGRLIRMTAPESQEEISQLKEKDFLGLCQILNIKPKATKKLTARASGEAKILKKISDIRKQTY